MDRNAQTLANFQSQMGRKDTAFVPFVMRVGMPIPMTMHGPASRTLADAEARVREALTKPAFTAGWVVSKQAITEIR